MIKNDKWIRKMCTPPRFVVTRAVLPLASDGSVNMGAAPVMVEEFSHAFAYELGEQMSRSLNSDLGIRTYRPISSDELAAWTPMVFPFEPNQVREIERSGTSEEIHILKSMGEEFLRNRIGSSVKNIRVDPLLDLQVRQKIVSYGTSSFGYDVRLGRKFKIFTNISSGVIDPLAMEDKCYVDFEGDTCIIPPNSYVLGHTVEIFKIPRDVMVLCVGKSTYARCGAIVNVTPIEAGFEGDVVIEISNATNLPMKVHANQGIAQFLFFQSDEACETSYADRGGKYQGQRGVTTAKV